MKGGELNDSLYKGEGSTYVCLLVSTQVQLSLGRMTNTEYIQYQ
jgi:hypothetical protein